MNNNMTLPVSIANCPIIDALVEVRFETNIDPNAVFGLIYGALIKDYPGQVVNLPIMQLPEAVRMSDPGLRYKPLHRIISNDVIIQIGNDVLSISSPLPYIGWSLFYVHVVKIIKLISDAEIITRVSRLGHRYVNFFNSDILDKITMSFNMTEGYNTKNIQITTQVNDYNFDSTIQFSNTAVMNANTPNSLTGSIIDIDTFKEYNGTDFIDNLEEEINNAHKAEKTLFFSLLKPEFVESLKPKY